MSYGQVYINEFMASNTSAVKDPDYNNEADWIELYNDGTSEVNLDGYLSDNLNNPNKWRINAITISAKGFVILWADSKDSANHTNFNLSATAEQIGLYKPDLSAVDTLSYGLQDPNISYGRSTDGSSIWTLFTASTPGSSNISMGYSGIVKSDPSFSLPGGVFHSGYPLYQKHFWG